MKERDKRILQDYEHGVKLKDITKRHGVSVATVSNTVRKYGKSKGRTRSTPENVKAAILNLLAQGVAVRRISELTGVSEATIYRFKRVACAVNLEKRPPYTYPGTINIVETPQNHGALIAFAAGFALIIVLLLVLVQ